MPARQKRGGQHRGGMPDHFGGPREAYMAIYQDLMALGKGDDFWALLKAHGIDRLYPDGPRRRFAIALA